MRTPSSAPPFHVEMKRSPCRRASFGSAVRGADVVSDHAVRGRLAVGAKDRRAVAHGIVAEVVLDDVVVAAPVDVVDAAIHPGESMKNPRSTARCSACSATSRCHWGADRLARLEARSPDGAPLDDAVLDLEQHDAIPVDVVHDRVTDGDIPRTDAAVALRRAIDDDARPLGGVVSRHAVDDHVFERLVAAAAATTSSPDAFVLGSPPTSWNHHVADAQMSQHALVAET